MVFTCDWADWIEPKLVGPKGTLPLTDLKWVKASSQWGEVRKNANAGGQPLSVKNKSVGSGSELMLTVLSSSIFPKAMKNWKLKVS